MASRAAYLKKTYNLTEREWERLQDEQQGRCAICRCKPRRLVVDHNHQTGRVRGLLCDRCNHDLLGAAHDQTKILYAAIAYLELPPANWLYTAGYLEAEGSTWIGHDSEQCDEPGCDDCFILHRYEKWTQED